MEELFKLGSSISVWLTQPSSTRSGSVITNLA